MCHCPRDAFSLEELHTKFSNFEYCANIYRTVNVPGLLGQPAIGFLVGPSALVDTEPRDFVYILIFVGERLPPPLTTCGDRDLDWVMITGGG